jgi:hypothetical protein
MIGSISIVVTDSLGIDRNIAEKAGAWKNAAGDVLANTPFPSPCPWLPKPLKIAKTGSFC